MRSRLVLLIAIPTLTAVVLGGTSILSYARTATADGRVQQLATLSADITVLSQQLEDERDQTAYYIGLGMQGGRAQELAAGKGGWPVPPSWSGQQQYGADHQAARW